jgi:hypothetical protein
MIMKEVDFHVFDALFREACLKCFGHPMAEPLTETESRLMYARIFDDTGLVIGWKSIKNYSVFVSAPAAAKPENPSVATMDTLSRYVMGAPYTTEPERKKEAGHYPYWYDYKAKWAERGLKAAVTSPKRRRQSWVWVVPISVVVLALFVVGVMILRRAPGGVGFANNFSDVSMDTLSRGGWWVESPDTFYWKKRGETPGCLTLYTLQGDYWPDSVNRPKIRNLLLHRLGCDCWTVEVHLKDFVPGQNWQQAGILLMEDTGFKGKSMRISIAYNDYNGVYPRSGTVLVQAISSRGTKGDKPEEFAHVILLQTDSLRTQPLLFRTLTYSALRIEKQGDRFRILYADGIGAYTSFREIVSHDFAFQPRYIGLFALRGHVDSGAAIPARFSWFGLDCCTP